jgi:O-antigen ligase
VLESLRSSTLERALQVAIVATIVSAVLAAGAILSWLDDARKLRWLALAALAGLALLYALQRRDEWRPRAALVLAGAFVGLAFLSVLWSSDPRLSLGRAASFAILLGGCACIAIGAAGRLRSVRRMLDAILAATGVVGLGGLLVLLFAHDRAVQPATAQEPARYQGLGGGPNTATMVLAVGLPLAAYVLVEGRTWTVRALALGLALLLLGSIVASGSRGALAAAFAGLAVFGLLAAPTGGRRALVAAGVAALLAVGVVVTRLPAEDPSVPALPGTSVEPVATARPGYVDANEVCRLQEDVGRPAPCGRPATGGTSRSFLGGSGRVQAWGGALRLAAKRPAAGYGFGMEGEVFVDRYFDHGSNLPENSYVGVLLQLGLVGLALFALLVVALAAGAARALRGPPDPAARLAAACAGGLTVGLVLALTQSFIYSAGSNATAAVWLCGFLLLAVAAVPDARAA